MDPARASLNGHKPTVGIADAAGNAVDPPLPDRCCFKCTAYFLADATATGVCRADPPVPLLTPTESASGGLTAAGVEVRSFWPPVPRAGACRRFELSDCHK